MATSRASDMLIAIWSFCEPEDREAFVSYLAIGGYLNSFSPSASRTAEPEAVPSPPTASGNHLYPDPHTPGAATAGPANQALQTPAQNGDVDSHIVGQGGHRPAVHLGHAVQEDASAAQTGNEAGSVSGATVTNSKPDCLDPGNCKVPFTSALCASCNDARMMRRAAE